MRKEGYGDGFAGAVIRRWRVARPIIPPSIPMVVYAQLASQSVVKLFMAGVVPGLLLAAGFMVVCSIVARVRNYPSRTPVPWAGKAKARPRRLGAADAGDHHRRHPLRAGHRHRSRGRCVIYSLLVSLLIYRGLRYNGNAEAAVRSGTFDSGHPFSARAAGPFSGWWPRASQPDGRRHYPELSTNPITVLLIINAFLLLIGCIVEPLPAMIIFLPVLIPLGAELGIDPIQFGAVVVLNLMIGLMHPPIGLLLFVVSSVGKIRIAPG